MTTILPVDKLEEKNKYASQMIHCKVLGDPEEEIHVVGLMLALQIERLIEAQMDISYHLQKILGRIK